MADNKRVKSNYARKRAYLAKVNRRPNQPGDDANGRIFGFHFADGEKPWKKAKG